MPAPVPGTVVSSGSAVGPGGDTGLIGGTGPTGATGATGPNAVSTDANNLATLGSDNLIAVPASSIWSMRLRSYNAVGNPNFEVDQRQPGTSGPISGGMIDRWVSIKTGMASATGTIQQLPAGLPDLCIPGTNFRISRAFLRVTLTAQQASLAAGDQLYLHQEIEGPNWRELSNDVHSVALLVRSSVAGLKFGLTLRDPVSVSQSLTKLCTITSANTWTLIQLPNIPVWPSGNFQPAPGISGYRLDIVLSAGSTFTATANDVWQSGNFLGALGQSNFAASPVNSTFDIGFLQHEPGSLCTTFQDKPFSQNLTECLRYYDKSYSYAVKPGTVTSPGIQVFVPAGGVNPITPIRFKQIMATQPTMTGYNYTTGAINSVRDATNSADRAISSTASTGDGGFNGFNVTGGVSTIWQALFHYTADTGW
jgi:hypothetical protein